MFVETKREGEIAVPARAELSLAGFIEWLSRQNPQESYDFCDAERCAFAQYSGRVVTQGNDPTWLSSVFNEIVVERPWTFGAALSRAKALR